MVFSRRVVIARSSPEGCRSRRAGGAARQPRRQARQTMARTLPWQLPKLAGEPNGREHSLTFITRARAPVACARITIPRVGKAPDVRQIEHRSDVVLMTSSPSPHVLLR